MIGDSGRTSASIRRAHARGVMGGSRRRLVAGVASFVLAGTGLAACSSASAGTGPVTLNYYLYPDTSGATQMAINNCDKQSGGKYTISYQQLPQGADGQRQQLVRRLAAHDSTIDIMGLDVTWEAEFATANWIEPWTGTYKAQAVAGTLVPALNTAIWKGQLVAVPDNTNTQLLWYRSDLVPTPPTTWAQDRGCGAAGQGGQAALHRDPGRGLRGHTVWFNTMLASATPAARCRQRTAE